MRLDLRRNFYGRYETNLNNASSTKNRMIRQTRFNLDNSFELKPRGLDFQKSKKPKLLLYLVSMESMELTLKDWISKKSKRPN